MRRHPEQGMNVVNLFSGCGGFSLGAHQAGFRVIAAVDNDPILSSSYPYNFSDTKMLLRDVTQLDGRSVREAAAGPVDGIFGGPPCQGFSLIGKRSREDPRRHTLGHFLESFRRCSHCSSRWRTYVDWPVRIPATCLMRRSVWSKINTLFSVRRSECGALRWGDESLAIVRHRHP